MLVASNFLVPNLTFVVELVAFLIVLAVLAKYVLPPLNKAMTDRQAAIRQALSDAEEARRRAQEAEAEYRNTMERARQDARAMADEARRAGDQLRASARERAEQEAERMVTRAQADIEAAVRRASEDLRREVSEIVLAVVEKVIGEGFTTEDHQALIERTIREVEAEASSSPVGADGGP
jgi:F-type H+-transporting ATPase subunit b